MDTSPCDFDKLEPKAVEKTIEAIDKALKDQPKDKVDKKKKQKVSYGKKNWPEALKRYVTSLPEILMVKVASLEIVVTRSFTRSTNS